MTSYRRLKPETWRRRSDAPEHYSVNLSLDTFPTVFLYALFFGLFFSSLWNNGSFWRSCLEFNFPLQRTSAAAAAPRFIERKILNGFAASYLHCAPRRCHSVTWSMTRLTTCSPVFSLFSGDSGTAELLHLEWVSMWSGRNPVIFGKMCDHRSWPERQIY